MESITNIYNQLSKKKNLKNLSFFLILNLSFMFVEVIYGLLSNSLGLLTDGAHMLLDSTAVIIGLYSCYLSDFKSDDNFNFGYNRSEILGTFINSVFLFFIAIYIVFESIERFISPKEIHSDNLILVSFIGLLVNLVGIYFFHDQHDDEHEHHHLHHHEHESSSSSHSHDYNENLYTIYIHILADTLGSVAVLLSSFLIKYYKLYISDPICSLFISIMIFYSSYPVVKNAMMTLMHLPNEKLMTLKKKIEDGMKMIKGGNDEIISIGKFDLWMMKKDYIVVEMKVDVSKRKDYEDNKKDNDYDSANSNTINKESNVNKGDLANNEIEDKIVSVLKNNKINEYYIEVN